MLAERNPAWYESFAKTLQQVTGVALSGKDILKQYTNSEGEVQATPYYCITTNEIEYLPTALCMAVYKTSGGAAGNTMEEAIRGGERIAEVISMVLKGK